MSLDIALAIGHRAEMCPKSKVHDNYHFLHLGISRRLVFLGYDIAHGLHLESLICISQINDYVINCGKKI